MSSSAPATRASVRSVLHELGYVSFTALSGEFVIAQFQCERVAASGIRHLCDVHWKIVNRLRFADAVQFDELADAAIPLPMLGPGARGLGRMHALWLACVHRAAHHYDQDTLLWLYDVHLLVEALDAGGLERFVALAERSGVRRICLRALLLARTRFATRIPPAVLTALEAAPADEPSTVFLNPNIRQIDVLRDDLRALPGWRARLMLLKEHVFPSATYMREGYAPGSSAPVLWLYLGRIVTGARKWLSSLGEASSDERHATASLTLRLAGSSLGGGGRRWRGRRRNGLDDEADRRDALRARRSRCRRFSRRPRSPGRGWRSPAST